MSTLNRMIWILVALLAVAAFGGCSSDSPTRTSTGTLSVFLTDAPLDLDGVTAVNVTLGGLTLYPASEEPEGAPAIRLDLVPAQGAEEVSLNLLDYRDGEMLLLASAAVPEGDYRRIRMDVVAAEIVRDDDGDPDTPDTNEPVFVPSSKVDVPVSFTVSAGDNEEVVLDFDAELSVQVNETPGMQPYILRPVINAGR